MPESRQANAARSEPPGASSAKAGEPDPLIGRTINGRFKILGVIARGGMGKVYKAEQSPLGRICALKVLSPKYEGDRDPEFHKRFFLEASTAAKLTHPNTVTIFDYGQDGDELYYIAMEYIEGRTLHRVLREEHTIEEERVIHVASQICRSLREAHNLGVVHRDLKPGNILLSDRSDERDIVKVLDFGLVKDVTGEAEDLTQAGLFMGSPKYMAPEQILGEEITARTDIYSLGVMMYEMITGKVPFDRGASVGTLMAHVNDPPPPIRTINPKAQSSPAMEAIVYRCLEKQPDKRYVSMKDLLNALKRVGTNGSALTDTHESMPMARADMTSSPPSGRPTDTNPTAPAIQLPGTGPESSKRMQMQQQPVFASPSISEMLSPGPAPTDTGAIPPQPQKSRAYIWGLAAAVAVGIGAVVMLTSSKPRPIENADGPSPSASASPRVAAQPTAPSTAAEPATPAPSVASPSTPALRVIKVESEPSGGSVTDNGTEVCSATPCEITWKGDAVKAEHKLVINKKGYKNYKVTVGAGDEKVSAKLDVIPTGGGGPRPPPPPGTGGDGQKRKPNPYGD
jgi:eukaryotic-like serine/threonine-protein kinase